MEMQYIKTDFELGTVGGEIHQKIDDSSRLTKLIKAAITYHRGGKPGT